MPVGIHTRKYTGIMGTALQSGAAPNAAEVNPQDHPAPTASSARMNKQLAKATHVVSQPVGPFRANGVDAQNQETSSTVLDQDLLSIFQLPGSSDQQARKDYAYALAALQAAVGERTGIPLKDLMGWCCEEPMNVPDDFKSLTGDAMRTFARNGPAFDVMWKVKMSKGTTLEALPDEKTATRQALQAIDELIAMDKLTPDTAHDWKSVARTAHDRSQALLTTRLGSDEPSDALAWMTLAHAGHPLSGAEGDAPAGLRAASVAWRNGFTKSGTGTDFNRAVHRMHKVATWINRAEQPSNPYRFVQRILGRQLSPLQAMKPGLLGADLGDIATETSRLARHTRAAVERLRTALDETISAATYAQLDARSKAILQSKKAVLDHWESLGDNLPDGAVMSTRHALEFIEQMPKSPGSHPQAAQAIRILQTGFSLSVLESWAASPEVSAHINTVELRNDTGKARDAADPRRYAQTANKTREEFLAAARTAVETEGVQFRHGGYGGLEPSISVPFVMGAPGFSGVGGSVRGTKGRSATMRIGTSTIGSDIFIGTEKRWSAGGSVFAFAGASPDSNVKLGAAGRAAYRYEQGNETGVSLRVSKNVADHKAQCLDIIEFLFKKAPDTDNGSNDAPGLWERFANEFFDSDVSVNFVEGESTSNQVALAGNAGGGWVNEKMSVGAHLRADFERRTSQSSRIETTGHTTSNTAIDRLAISVPIQARIGWNPIPSVTLAGAPAQIDNVGAVPMTMLAYRAEFTAPSGSAGQIRLTMEGDRIAPALSLQQREFSGQDHFIGHLQERREEWETALGGVSNFDAVMADIRSLNMAPHQAAGNRRYTERLRLTTEAADSLTLLHAQRTLCHGDDNAASRKLALDAAFEARLHDAKSWEPEKLAVFEVAKRDETVGPDYLMVAKTFVQTTSVTRYLYQAKAGPVAERQTTADAIAQRERQLHSQSEAFLDVLGVLYGGRDVEYLGSLHRALIHALPASEGPTPFADALEVAQAIRQLEWPTPLESIQVLASIMSGQPGGTARINRQVQELRATLAESEPGRAALARLPAP